MEEKRFYIKDIIIGVAISFISTMLLFLIFACMMANTSISENLINPSIIILSGISIFFGAGIASKKVQKKGIFVGAAIGGIYIILMYIISSILSGNFSINMYSVMMILISILMGGIGGILGVNMA